MTISTKKTPILHIINGEYFAGAERVQDLLALSLPEFGYEVGFICLKQIKFSMNRTSKVPLFDIPMQSKFDLMPAREIARIIKQDGYVLIHTHTPRAALVGCLAAWLAGVPMVHHIHSPASRDSVNVWRNFINMQTERLSLIRVSHLISVSLSLACYLKEQGWAINKITTVANGVSTPGPLLNRPAPNGEWVIGCVALFRPRKGIEVLIEAFAKLRQAGRRARLRMVGPFETTEYECMIKDLTQRLEVSDYIDWVGFTQNVNAEFIKMDVFVLPSLFGEGMPMAILEAMAAGVPTIASDVEGVSEVLKHGCTGLVVPAGDVQSLLNELLALIDGQFDWFDIREEAYRVQLTRFSDRSMAEGISRVYDKLMSPA